MKSDVRLKGGRQVETYSNDMLSTATIVKKGPMSENIQKNKIKILKKKLEETTGKKVVLKEK